MNSPAVQVVKISRTFSPGQSAENGPLISAKQSSKNWWTSCFASAVISSPVGSLICLRLARNDAGTCSSHPVTISLNVLGRCDQCERVSRNTFRCPACEGSEPHSSKPSMTITGIGWGGECLYFFAHGSMIRESKSEGYIWPPRIHHPAFQHLHQYWGTLIIISGEIMCKCTPNSGRITQRDISLLESEVGAKSTMLHLSWMR